MKLGLVVFLIFLWFRQLASLLGVMPLHAKDVGSQGQSSSFSLRFALRAIEQDCAMPERKVSVKCKAGFSLFANPFCNTTFT